MARSFEAIVAQAVDVTTNEGAQPVYLYRVCAWIAEYHGWQAGDYYRVAELLQEYSRYYRCLPVSTSWQEHSNAGRKFTASTSLPQGRITLQ